ncbi:fatty acid desaturase family protein [Antarctobacter jejuensis]|uniref:fatty acid desaturase family protein n=1 Tax=Antarctobacter jejuensis TaxID=1439938 RepID=UPI003FD3D623
MDHKQFLASLSPDTRAALTERSDLPGVLHLATHLGAIAVIGTLILGRVPGWPLLLGPQGILLVFLFTLLHETVHDTPFRSRWLNRAASWVAGLTLGLPPLWFRYFHFAHHRYTQLPGKDPELDSPKPETTQDWLIHASGLPVWKGHAQTLLQNASGRCAVVYVPEAKRPAVTREARLMLFIYGAVLALSLIAGSAALFWIWLLPMLLGQPFLRLYLLAEHGRCAFVANMLENTRTTFTNRFVRWLAWNMPYHTEHHSLPTVPFHQLPALHALMADHLRVTERGYHRFTTDYIAQLK